LNVINHVVAKRKISLSTEFWSTFHARKRFANREFTWYRLHLTAHASLESSQDMILASTTGADNNVACYILNSSIFQKVRARKINGSRLIQYFAV